MSNRNPDVTRPILAATLVAAFAVAVLGAAPARAQTTPDPRGTFSFTLENDTFAGTDKGYTSGFLFQWRSPSLGAPAFLRWAADHSLFLLPSNGQVRWGAGFGQNIYTPVDTDLRVPDPTDRPYAGWLYGTISLTSYAEAPYQARRMNVTKYGAIELQVGVVGPSALGEQVQNNVHDFMNIDRALGWDSQLKDQPGANLVLTRQWRINLPLDPDNPGGLAGGFVPSFTASLGNVQTYGSAGLLVRFGRNLEADFGPPRIRPAPAGSGFFQPEGKWGWYVFAGGDLRAVAVDVFLDGNSWRDSASVDKRNFVGDGVFGFAVITPWARISYSHTFRSREFDTQQELQQFGSLTASFRL